MVAGDRRLARAEKGVESIQRMLSACGRLPDMDDAAERTSASTQAIVSGLSGVFARLGAILEVLEEMREQNAPPR